MSAMTFADACATIARQRAEPLPGTAPHATGWVVVEVDGPWAPKTEDNLPAAFIDRWQQIAAELPLRLQLLRTPGSHPRSTGRHRVLLAHSGPQPWMRLLDDVDDAALAGLDMAATAAPRPPAAGQAVEDSWLLVCTHGTRDRCCAAFGRPVVDALDGRVPQVAETSHVGGHRFAGNVLVLPDGLLYGGVDAPSAIAIVQAHAGGHLVPGRLRGRTSLPPAAQAAEIFVRQRWALDDARLPVDVRLTGEDTATVTVGGRRALVRLSQRSRPPAPLSCGEAEQVATEFVADEIRPLDTDEAGANDRPIDGVPPAS